MEDLIDINAMYRVQEFAPDFFIIGSDYGGHAFAIDKRTRKFYEMPFIGMSAKAAVLLGQDFKTFVDALSNKN